MVDHLFIYLFIYLFIIKPIIQRDYKSLHITILPGSSQAVTQGREKEESRIQTPPSLVPHLVGT